MSKKKKLRDINHTHLAHYLNKSGTDSLLLKLGREGLTTGGVCVVKCVPLEGNVYYMKQRCRNCSVDDAIKFVKTLIPYPEGRYSNIDYPFVLESLEAIREKLKSTPLILDTSEEYSKYYVASPGYNSKFTERSKQIAKKIRDERKIRQDNFVKNFNDNFKWSEK